jgi:hypothetical protein
MHDSAGTAGCEVRGGKKSRMFRKFAVKRCATFILRDALLDIVLIDNYEMLSSVFQSCIFNLKQSFCGI